MKLISRSQKRYTSPKSVFKMFSIFGYLNKNGSNIEFIMLQKEGLPRTQKTRNSSEIVQGKKLSTLLVGIVLKRPLRNLCVESSET